MDPLVDKVMLARKKDGPLMPKWAAIKGKHKALNNRSIFKADAEPSIKAYDDAVQRYADAIEGKKQLMNVLQTFTAATQKMASVRDKLISDRNKSEIDVGNNKNSAQVTAYTKQPDADPAAVLKALTDLAASRQASADLHKKVVADLIANDASYINDIKSARDDYKTMADKVNSGLQKAYDDSDKAQEGIRAAVTDCMDTADEIENVDLKKQLQAFYKFAAH